MSQFIQSDALVA